MPKKILIFSLAYYPKYYGGAEVAIKEITDRISPQDIEFHMVTMRFDSRLPRHDQIGNVVVHRVGFGLPGAELTKTHSALFYLFKILFVPMAAVRAVQLNRRHQFDGIWAMMSYMLFPIMLARLLGVRVPYALTLQEGDPFEHVFERWYIAPFSFLLRRGFRGAAVVQAISTFLSRWAYQYGHTGVVEVIPNGVDTKRFEGIPVPHDEKVLITTSRLVHKNAIDDVVRALPLLPDVRFEILGTGPDEEMIKTLAAELGITDRAVFAGQVDHTEMPAHLHRADIFVRPSRSEGMGNSFVEAMAAELPVIATQEGGIVDFLFDAKRNPDKPTTGWAVDKDSPEQIAVAVKDIIGNPAQTKKVIQNARELVIQKYDWDLIAQDMRKRVFARVL